MIVTGNEQLVLERTRALYNLVAHWLEDADIDFQLHNKKKSPKEKHLRPRRWD